MSYTPKTWNCGDTITAEDLNHIEQGIANSEGGTLVIRADHQEGTAPLFITIYDKTYREVEDALASGQRVFIQGAAREPDFPKQCPVVRAEDNTVIYYDEGENSAVSAFRLYACSADGYLQDVECDGDDPIS